MDRDMDIKMDKKTFAQKLRDAVWGRLNTELDKSVEIEILEVIKINDMKLTGLSFGCDKNKSIEEDTNERLSLTFYADEMYKDYEAGKSLEEIAEILADDYKLHLNSDKAFPEALNIMEKDKSKFSFMILEKSRNREFLSNTPYKDLGEGFVAVAMLVRSDGRGGIYSATINYALLGKLKLAEEELFEKAFAEAMETMPPILRLLEFSWIADARNLLSEEERLDVGGRYVLMNENQRYGAAVLFYDGIKEKIAEKLGKSYYILPSSVHEVIIVPYEKDINPQLLCNMVIEVNKQLEQNEVLCDKVLLYDDKSKKLMIAVE